MAKWWEQERQAALAQSAPKADKPKKKAWWEEERENAAKAAAAPTPVAASTGITPEERARRIAEGIPLDPVLPDNSSATSTPRRSILEDASRSVGEGITTVLKGAKGGTGALVGAVNAMGTLPVAAGIDALTGGTAATDFAARNFVEPAYRMSAEDQPAEDDSLTNKVLYGLGRFAPDLAAMAATRGASIPMQVAASAAPRAAVGAAIKEATEMSLLPSISAGAGTAKDVIDRGGSTGQAFNSAAADFVGNSVTNALPLSAAGDALTRAITGTSAGIVGEGAVNVLTNTALPSDMRRDLLTPESVILSGALGGTMATAFGQRPDAVSGVMAARKKLADAGALADGAPLRGTDGAKKPDAFVPDPKINEALAKQAAEKVAKEGVGRVVPPTAEKAPVAPPVQPQGASTPTPTITPKAIKKAQGQAASLLATDTTFAAEVQANPLSLKDRVAAFARIEQEKLDKAAAKKAATEAAKIAAAQVAQDAAVAPVLNTPTATVTEPMLGNQSGVNVALSAPPKEQTSVTNSASPIVPTISTRPTVTTNEASNSVPVVEGNMNPAAGTAILPTEVPSVKKGKKGKVQPVQQPVITPVEGVAAQQPPQDVVGLQGKYLGAVDHSPEELVLLDNLKEAAKWAKGKQKVYNLDIGPADIEAQVNASLSKPVTRSEYYRLLTEALEQYNGPRPKKGQSASEFAAEKAFNQEASIAATELTSPAVRENLSELELRRLDKAAGQGDLLQTAKILSKERRQRQPAAGTATPASLVAAPNVTQVTSVTAPTSVAEGVATTLPATPTEAPVQAPAAPEATTQVPFDPANASFPAQPTTVEATVPAKQRLKIQNRFAPKGVVGTVSVNAPVQHATTPDAPDASLDITEPTTGEKFASKEDLLTELNSGFADKEAIEARKVADSIVVYDGDADLQSIDPEVAAQVEAAAAKQGATGARPRAFQFKGKVYFNMQGVKKGEAKSTFLHEARVHLAAEREPARISSLAGRVVALAKLGDATAKEAADTVGKEYPGLMEASKEGSDSAKDRAREEVLADFVQRVYERTKAGQGVTGLAKRLYSDAVSYLRDVYTRGAKKYLGEKFALTIKDTDILDAVRYGRTASGFKGESKPTRSAQARDKSAAFAMAPPVANPADVPKALKAIPRGLKGRVDKFVPELLKLFSHTLGASRPVSDMVREAHGMRNFKDWQVENLLADTTSTLKKTLGKRADMYNDELVKALTGKPNTLPPAVRDSVQQARTLIDQLSIKLIAIGAVSPRKLASVIKRLGSYVHADYKAWKMGPGEWQSLQESPRGDGSNNATDLIMSVLPEMMADIALPPDAQLDALAAAAKGTNKKVKVAAKKELEIMLGRYGYTKDKDSLAKKIAFLKKTRDNFTPESFKEFAAELARKLMNPKGIVIDESMPLKPFSVDSTGMRKKTAVPAWQKRLWGEYEEYDAIVINTVRMLGGMLDKWTAMQGYKQQLIDEGILVENSVPIGYTKLSNKDPMVYGPLNGYAIRDRDLELVDALAKQGIQGVSALLSGLTIGGKAADALAKGSSYTKVMAIVLAPDAWIFNAASTVMLGTLASGHPLAIAQHGKRAADFASREAFAGMGRTTKLVETDIQDVFEILFKEGVLGDAALSQDLRSDLAERVIDEAYKNAPTAKRMWHQTKAGAGRATDIGGRGLAVGDTAGKILSVYARIPYLRNIYPNKDFKELLTIAAKETANSLPSMSRSIPIAKAIARQGLVMPFAGYFAETFRNTVNDIGLGFKYQIQGLKAMKAGDTKEGAAAFLYGSMIHAGNLARHSLVWSFRSGIAASIYGLYQLAVTAFDDDDDEEDDTEKQAISAQIEAARKVQQDPEAYKAIRELLPDYFTGDAILLREVEPGVFAYTTTQRLDMYTTGAALTAYERTGKWEDAAKAMFEPFLTQSLIARPVVDLLKGREGAEWDLAAALFVPGPVKRADRIVKAEAKGYEMTAFEKSMHMGGMSVAFVDVKQELANKMQGLASDMNDQMKSVSNSLDPNRTDVTERYTDSNDFQSELVEAVRKQGKAFKEFQPILKAADKMGISSGDVIATAKLNGVTLAKKDLAGLLMGKFIPPRAAQIVTNKWKTELKAASQNPRQVSRINAYYTRALEDAELIDEAVNAMLVSEGVETLQ